MVGFNLEKAKSVTSYKTQVVLNPELEHSKPQEEVDVFVYPTDRSGEDMFIHEIRDQEGKPIEYFVAPKNKQI